MENLLIIFLFFLVIVALTYFLPPDVKKLIWLHRIIVRSLNRKFESKLIKLEEKDRIIIRQQELMDSLNAIEKKIALSILEIARSKTGIKGKFYSLNIPEDLIPIPSVKFRDSNRESGIQYLPAHVHTDFNKMQESILSETSLPIHVDSGYRSPGRQTYLFFKYLAEDNAFSIQENVKWIAIPGFSEHSHPINTAVDIANDFGINGFSEGQSGKDFEKLDEYSWLIRNASKYNFYMSFPENNDQGISFEPWHWHWEQKGS